MSLINSNQQYDVSEQRRLPVDNVGSDESIAITGETVQLNFYNAGVFTADAGEAAGTVVVAKLANRNVKNALGDVTGTHLDSSLGFTSTALTEEVAFPYLVAATNDVKPGADKADAITDGFENGQYCVDYRTGAIYGVKASATTTLTNTAYKIEASTSITPPGAASEVELVDGSGNAIATTEDTASTLRGFNVFGTRADFDGAALPTLADTEGDSISQARSGNGVAFVTLVSDDGSDYGQIKGYDLGTDSVKGFEISPLSSHHVEETLANVTNGVDGTYNYYVDMDGYRNFALQTTLNGGSGTATMTIEATLQDDGTAAASCTYVDVTTALFGAASYTASAYHIVDTPVSIKYLKVKIVAATGAADDADWTLYFKKMY